MHRTYALKEALFRCCWDGRVPDTLNSADQPRQKDDQTPFCSDVNVDSSMELNQVPLRQNLLDLNRPSDRGEPFDTDILEGEEVGIALALRVFL